MHPVNALLAAQLLLLVGAALCLLPLRNAWRAGMGLATQALAAVLVLGAAAPVLMGAPPLVGELAWAYPVGTLRLRLDALGAFFLAWSLPMTLLGSLYAVGYLRRHFETPAENSTAAGPARHVGVHFALLNLTALAFVLVYTADHALVFLLGWEIAALAAWLLVIWDYSNQKVRFAGFNYLVSTHVGLMFLVAAFMVLYTHSGSWEMGSFGRWLQAHPGAERDVVFALLLISFALKSAFFPFHSWLPRAHAAAPAHVSALMSGVIHKAGLYALVRFVLLMGQPDEWMGWFLIGFSLVSAVIGALYTVGQRDLKRLLGYSSTENVGIAGLGLGVGCLGLSWAQPALVVLGFGGGLLHVLNHAVFKCQLFYAAGAVYQATHTVDMEKLGGLARLMPYTAVSFLIGGVAISALPPLNGFASELVIYSGLFSRAATNPWAQAALVATAAGLAFVGAVSALSITRAYGVVFMGVPRETHMAHGAPAHEVTAWMRGPTLLHAAAAVVLGLAPLLGLALVEGAVRLALQALQATAGLAGAPGAQATGEAALQSLAHTLTRAGGVSCLLAAAMALLWGAQWLRQRTRSQHGLPVAHHRTWGCGYTAPNTRMQYTGSSFSWDFARRFEGVLVMLRRQKAPEGYFPTDATLLTHCPDAVERRLFRVIAQGDKTAAQISSGMHEDDPRLSFAAVLVVLALIGAVVVLAGGPLP